GTSNVHIRSIADFVLEKTEEQRLPAPKIEGKDAGEWVLIDFGDVVVHVMAEETRDRYKLEQFWTTPQPKGALPPTPDTTADNSMGGLDAERIGNFDQDEEDEFDDEDADFFDEADQEVEPIDEDDDFDADAQPGKPTLPSTNGQKA
ncbi:MAG: ribosome silencing factor, partial [Cytophagales bacterium]|nr:ribosome silencing factor [Armatimonadota bacterium]